MNDGLINLDEEYEKVKALIREEIALNDRADTTNVDTLITCLKNSEYYKML